MKLLTTEEHAALLAGTANVQFEEDLLAAARALVQRARELGLVLTVEQRSVPPLAMGNYVTDVAVRPGRKSA